MSNLKILHNRRKQRSKYRTKNTEILDDTVTIQSPVTCADFVETSEPIKTLYYPTVAQIYHNSQIQLELL